MLSIMQEDILNMLKYLHSLRREQIEMFLLNRYGSTKYQCDTMLNQLRTMGKVMFQGDYALCAYHPLDMDSIKAFDIMLDISKGKIQYVKKGNMPFKLMFLLHKNKNPLLDVYGIIIVKTGAEADIAEYLSAAEHKFSVLLAIEDMTQIKLFEGIENCYFVYGESIGNFKYFSDEMINNN